MFDKKCYLSYCPACFCDHSDSDEWVPIETVGQMLGHRNIQTTQHHARVADTKVTNDMQPLKEKYQGQLLTLSEEIA